MQINNKNQFLQLLKGALTGSLFLILTILLISFILYKTVISEKFYLPLMMFCIVLSGFISGYVSTRKYRKNGLVTGALSTLFTVIVLSISIIIANKGFNIFILIPIIILVISGMSGGVFAVNIKRKNIRR